MPEILEPVERLIAGNFALCSATCSSATLCFWSVGWHDRCSTAYIHSDCRKSLLTIERGRYGGNIFNSLKAWLMKMGWWLSIVVSCPLLLRCFPMLVLNSAHTKPCAQFYPLVVMPVLIQTMSLGAFAGTQLAQASCHPLDVVRSGFSCKA